LIFFTPHGVHACDTRLRGGGDDMAWGNEWTYSGMSCHSSTKPRRIVSREWKEKALVLGRRAFRQNTANIEGLPEIPHPSMARSGITLEQGSDSTNKQQSYLNIQCPKLQNPPFKLGRLNLLHGALQVQKDPGFLSASNSLGDRKKL
jgi:hypothetical protein